ncbi:MAG TPA: beta-propeller domain-containing protein, partial [Acidimicrobiales bacterium]|nr:beta-propeller domain-containing protein [Acidimicrobiales bacterium]
MIKQPKVQSAVIGLLAALCLVGIGVEATRAGKPPVATANPAVKLTGASLVSYTNCSQMLQQVKAQALKEVGPYGLAATTDGVPYGEVFHGVDFGPGPVVAREGAPLAAGMALQGAAVAGTASAPSDASSQPQAYSTTNNQEAGVDEPDMVKTNGQLMVILRQQPQGLQVVDVSGSTPVLDGFLALPQFAELDGMFLVGQDAVVIGSVVSPSQPVNYASGGAPVPLPYSPAGRVGPGGPMIPASTIERPVLPPFGGGASSTDVVVVSLANPQAPSVLNTFSFQSQEQGARLINGQVVLVLTNQPRLPWVYASGGAPAAQKAATAANRALIESSRASDWLPSTSVTTGRGKSAKTVTRAASCAATYHTAIASGLGTVSVVSLDPTSDAPGSEVTVLGNAENVYVSATQLYVATTAWQFQSGWTCPPSPFAACPMEPADVPASPVSDAISTDIYGFDISNPSEPRYIGSGTVPGTLIGQYAMSEYNGYLRVATTAGEPTPAPVDGGTAPAQLSDNIVSVLQPDNGALASVGKLDGLGSGEKIYSVRFEGDLGYVVTFNQVDPLYVIDLSDPRQPALAGQVSLSGYSSFLQPLSAGLLLGVGQAVDQTLAPQGLQVEVFD